MTGGVLWLLGLLLWAGALRAPAAVQFDVFAGYGPGANQGVARRSAWFPVVFEVANDGPTFRGEVELEQESGQTRLMALELPSGTRKRFTIPVYSSGQMSKQLHARLRDESGRVRAEALQLALRTVDSRSVLLGALSRTRPGLPVFPPPPNQQSPITLLVAPMQPALFPDHPMALEGLTTIYVHSSQAMELKAPQAEALLAWTRGGGRLIVAVDQPGELEAAPWLRDFLPCKLSGLAPSTNQAALQDWLVSKPASFMWEGLPESSLSQSAKNKGNVPLPDNPYAALAPDPAFVAQPMDAAGLTLRDGRVVAGQASRPWVVAAGRGRGEVVVLAFNPEVEPFRSWKNRDWFWARLSDAPARALVGGVSAPLPGLFVDGVFGSLIDSRQIRKLPVPWLLALLAAYLIVIGPLDYYWLKKIKRQMLTWITFPCYVAIFSVLIYLIGYKLRAGESEWNEFHLVDILPGAETATLRGRAYASVYSPVNAAYPVQGPESFSVMRGEQSREGSEELSRSRLEQTGGGFKGRVTAPVWTSQLYESDWLQTGPAPLRASILPHAEGWEVRVGNAERRRMSAGWLVIDGRIFDLGVMTSGATNLLRTGGGIPLYSWVRSRIDFLSQAVRSRQSQWGGQAKAIPPDPFETGTVTSFATLLLKPEAASQNAYSFFSAPAYFDLSAQVERGDAVLLAALPGQSLTTPINQFNPRFAKRDTLLRLVIPAASFRGVPR